jgi:hypothetical protein
MTELLEEWEIVLTDVKTGETRVIRRKLIEAHVNSLALKESNGTIEGNYRIINFYRVNETYEL